MSILGAIIKGAVQLGQQFTEEKGSPAELQAKTLRELLTRAKDTAFGQRYQFDKILEADDIAKAFAAQVPLHSYESIYDQWWGRQKDGEKDITWPGRTEYFALSSATTATPRKSIPVTEDMVQAIRTAGIRQILALANFELPSELFERDILMLGSTTQLQDKGEFREGAISGISASRIPFWFESYYKPGRDIANIEDFEARLQEIAVQAPNWDVGALSGIPAWIQLMLERVIAHNGLNNIHEIWPGLHIFATGGMAYEPYRKNIESLLAHPITIIDTYLASEGFLAFQTRPETPAMALLLNNGIYFEFAPFSPGNFRPDGTPEPHVPILHIGQVEEGREYALLISTCSGAWRYAIGDTVQFTDKARNEIVITGRTKHYLSAAGEQLSVAHMNEAVRRLSEDLNLTYKEFTVVSVPHGNGFAHHWYIGLDQAPDAAVLQKHIDATLCEINQYYRQVRGKRLKEVFVHPVSPDLFYGWQAKNNKLGGQHKLPRVLSQSQYEDWKQYLEQRAAVGQSGA